MIAQAAASDNSLFISPKLLRGAGLPRHLRRLAERLASPEGAAALPAPVVAAFASEFLIPRPDAPLEFRKGASVHYFAILDVPDGAVMRLPSVLELRRPEQRLHLTCDAGVLRRLLVASVREDPRLGIVDAYLLGGELVILCGDLESRSFPIARLPGVAELVADQQDAFEIDSDGSYLYWPAGDLHLGVSQLLQAADPAFLADVYIKRNSNDFTGRALRQIREERGLRQVDIPGLSERQVRRIEDGISRLRVASAECFALALGIPLNELLEKVARRASALRPAA
ncbi:MAG TPA: hypothetical protein VFJ16_19995 [Longimicrobium sp.]|nr:hypothetical protein [Longimicrobium sp.]